MSFPSHSGLYRISNQSLPLCYTCTRIWLVCSDLHPYQHHNYIIHRYIAAHIQTHSHAMTVHLHKYLPHAHSYSSLIQYTYSPLLFKLNIIVYITCSNHCTRRGVAHYYTSSTLTTHMSTHAHVHSYDIINGLQIVSYL